MAQRAGDARSMDEHEIHLSKIHQIVRDWQAGKISLSAKRAMVADLNSQYYGEPTKGDAGADITKAPRHVDEVLLSLADRAMIPVEAASAALAAQRAGSLIANEAEDLAEAKRILAEGRQAYQEILRASR